MALGALICLARGAIEGCAADTQDDAVVIQRSQQELVDTVNGLRTINGLRTLNGLRTANGLTTFNRSAPA